jgi:CubicO group peptidase (beta-lactamase class C family)
MTQIILSPSILAQQPDISGYGVQPRTLLKTIDGRGITVAELKAFIEQIMQQADVAGLSCAILNEAQIVYQKAFGFKNKNDGSRNDEHTLFSAASFSKTVFAYLVMLLAEEKVIDLDRPLYEYLDKPLYEYPAYVDLKDDDRCRQFNARMALSHTTGLPNVRFIMPEGKISILFPPGSRHSYSGEGIDLLQMVLEEVTGRGLEELAQVKIFQPLGMSRTSYIWQPEFEANYACPHDTYGRQR